MPADSTINKPVSLDRSQSIAVGIGASSSCGEYPILVKIIESGTAAHRPVSIHVPNCSVKTGIATPNESRKIMLLKVQIVPSTSNARIFVTRPLKLLNACEGRRTHTSIVGTAILTDSSVSRARVVVEVFSVHRSCFAVPPFFALPERDVHNSEQASIDAAQWDLYTSAYKFQEDRGSIS